jgi:hypothetical protein
MKAVSSAAALEKRLEIAERLSPLEDAERVGRLRDRSIGFRLRRDDQEDLMIRASFVNLARGMEVARAESERRHQAQPIEEDLSQSRQTFFEAGLLLQVDEQSQAFAALDLRKEPSRKTI